MVEQQFYIYGGYIFVISGCIFEIINLVNGNVLVIVQVVGCEDVDCVVKSVQQG